VPGQLQKATQVWVSLLKNLPWQKWVHFAPQAVTVLMIILVAKAASDLTWLVFAPDESGKTAARHSTPATPAQPTLQQRLRTVADLHLFGVASKPVVVKNALIDAKKTGLKLTLRGVFAVESDVAMALIADDRGKEKVYKKSDTIFSGVKLYEIYPDRVILERSGTFETLAFPEKAKLLPGIKRHAFTGKTSHAPVLPPTPEALHTKTIKASQAVKDSLATLVNDPQKFMQEARIVPVLDASNQIKGFTFDHNDKRLINALGLQTGDIIVEVNGQPVSDPSVLTSLFMQLGGLSELTLAIERNNQLEILNITL